MSTIAELFGAAVILPDAVDPAALRVDAADYTRYALVDRGSYDIARPALPPVLAATLARIASAATGRPALAIVDSRVLRLRAGDYLLAHHDAISDGNPVEVIADLSPSPVPVAGAEVHYRRRGQVFFRVPSHPGAASVVERGATVTCNHTYLSRRSPDAVVVRLVVLLR